MHELVIIGAGPIGLSTAIAATQKKLDYVVLEKGALVNSIFNGPINGTFFSTADKLEIGDIPFVSQFPKPSRSEICQYYRKVAEHYRLPIRFRTRVVTIKKKQDHFELTTEMDDHIHAKKVVVATGFYDQPNMLDIPGELLPKVSHYYKDAHFYYNQNVLIVGGRNSSVEAALEIFRAGGHVTLVHRGKSFSKGVKYWLLPDIENRIKEKSIQAFFSSKVVEIQENRVKICTSENKMVELENDSVLLLTGYHPDTILPETAGVFYDEQTGIPEHNPDTFETNISGLYIAGSPIAGKNCNRIFIENGRLHGKSIIRDIVSKLDQ